MNTPNSLTTPFRRAVVLLALVAAPTLLASDYSTTVLSHNPLAYWQYTEGAGSPAPFKLANSGSLGSVSDAYANSEVVNGVAGKVNNAIRLTNPGGTTGHVGSRADVVYNAGLNSPVYSIEFWANPSTLGGDSTGLCPLSNFNPNNFPGGRVGYLFYVAPTGRWNFRMGLSSGYAVNMVSSASATFAAVGVWQHIVATYDGSVAKLYINGALVASTTSSAASSGWVPNTGSFLRFGGTPLPGDTAWTTADGLYYVPTDQGATVSGNRGWDGYLDEVAVYTNALSASAVAAHYAAASTPATYGATILGDNPAGYWNFDEPAVTAPTSFPTATNSGTLLSDADGTNLWGAVNATPGPGYGGFPAGDMAVWFDGMNGSFRVKDAPGLHFSNNITLLAWVKPLANNYKHDIIEHGGDGFGQETFLRISRGSGAGYGTGHYYEMGASEGELNDGFYDGALAPMPPGDIGNWVFLAGTFDGANWNVYRNGALVAQLPPYNNPTSGDVDTGARDVTNNWTIGSRALPSAEDGNRFAGTVAEPAIFSNALSASDILALYNAAHVPPVLTRAVQLPALIFKGSSGAFNVWVDGNATLNYLWYSNGISTGVTATNITLNNLTTGPLTVAVVVTNNYGSLTSSVSTVIVASKPLIVQQPVAVTRYIGRPFSFSVGAIGTQPISYQWYTNSTLIPGATSSTYSGIVNPGTAGSYSCLLSNEAGTSNTISVALTSLALPPGYASTVIGDGPIAYWRLGETNGTVAHDYYGGNDGAYNSTTLGVQGYSTIDPDTAVSFSGLNSYVGGISGTAINFTGFTNFSLEAWVNAPVGQSDEATVIAKGIGATGTTRTEQFSLDVSGDNYRFFTTRGNTLYEADATVGPNSTWQHLVAVYDGQNTLGGGSNMYLYVNGELKATHAGNPFGLNGTTSVVGIGSKRTGNDPNYDGTFNGTVDEVAVYPYALSQAKVSAHYAAAYGPNLPPLITLQPQSVSNYAGLQASFQVGAGGTQPLTYQWYQGTTALTDGAEFAGSSTEKLTINPLGLADQANYRVTITNVNGISNSATVHLTVLTAPTSPPAIPGLVMHLPFNGNLNDVTGRGNNAVGIHIHQNLGVISSNVLAPTYVSDGMPAGNQGMHFSTTDIDGFNTNFDNFYATLGATKPDLQFGTNENFSVALWIRPPLNYVGNDLPYFGNAPGSTFTAPGIAFCYTYGTTVGATPGYPGGWAYSVLDSGSPVGGLAGRGEIGSINDGNWHHLVHVFDRKNGAATYLDGLPVPFHKQAGTSIQAGGSFDRSDWFTIGQDPTGLYSSATLGVSPPDASGDIDDLGVWKKALTPLEAASIYVAAATNHLSFVGAPIKLTMQKSGSQLILSWPAGMLQSATVVTGPWTDVTPVSPATVTIATTPGAKFYRVKL